jgi:hypothetical protein
VRLMTGLDFVREHLQVTRRYFFQLGGGALAAWRASAPASDNAQMDPQLAEAAAKLQYLTPPEGIRTVLDKAKAGVAKLPPERLREVGLVPETWSLDVVPDPTSDCMVEQPLSRELGNALDWNGLMRLAGKSAVRFMQVCTCTNGSDPYHMSLWEGVPLRDVIWLTRPKDNVRRVYYQSYHPENLPPFQSSLPLGQILENPPGLMPVILAYKRNGQTIPAVHGGPVRMIVPGAYGSKCVKWVQRAVLTNEFKANDTDADLKNDPAQRDGVDALLTRRAALNAAPQTVTSNPQTTIIKEVQGLSCHKMRFRNIVAMENTMPVQPYHFLAQYFRVKIRLVRPRATIISRAAMPSLNGRSIVASFPACPSSRTAVAFAGYPLSYRRRVAGQLP